MKKNLMLSLAIFMASTMADAQSIETIFTIQDTKDGEQVIDVRYQNVPSSFEMDNFAQADKNGDGCLDREEAHDMGILDFQRYARTNKNCLTEDEYMRAMHSSD